jgi:hypothetical protein
MISVLPSVSSSLARLTILTDQADWLNLYDRLEVWRSELGQDGPFYELSGDGFLQALLPPTVGPPSAFSGPSSNLVGLELDLLVNELYSVKVMFTGVNPLTRAAAAAQITTQAFPYATAYVDANGVLALQSLQGGGLSAVRVVGGSATTLLGVTVDDVEFGHDPRPVLAAGQLTYVFQDYFSDSTFFYKTRYSNSVTHVASAFSTPFSTLDRLGLDPALVVIGFVQLATPQGRAGESQEVLVFNSFTAQTVGSAVIAGAPKKYLTDVNGYVEFPLVRGISVDVSIGSTPFIRTIAVPTDPTVLKFNCFDPQYGNDDNFSVQRAQLPYATRTKL